MAEELAGFHLECKGTVSPSIPRAKLIGAKGWVVQVTRDCPASSDWVILHKANTYGLVALISGTHFKKIATGNICPIAVVADSFAPAMELRKAYGVLKTVQIFNETMQYPYTPTLPVIVYEIEDGLLIGIAAITWLRWVFEWKKRNEQH